MMPGSNLPVVVVTHHAPRWLRLLCVALSVLAVVLSPFAYRKSILFRHPELAFLFEPFGINYTQGLAISDLSVTKQPLSDNPAVDDKRMNITIDCNIINESKGSRNAPLLRVILYDADGNAIQQGPNMVDTGKNITSGSTLPCKKFTFEAKEGDVDHARLDLADRFDLRLRRK